MPAMAPGDAVPSPGQAEPASTADSPHFPHPRAGRATTIRAIGTPSAIRLNSSPGMTAIEISGIPDYDIRPSPILRHAGGRSVGPEGSP